MNLRSQSGRGLPQSKTCRISRSVLAGGLARAKMRLVTSAATIV